MKYRQLGTTLQPVSGPPHSRQCERNARYSWFATTWQGGHVGGQYNTILFRRICMKIEFSSQRRETVLFLTTTMAAVTSRANQQ